MLKQQGKIIIWTTRAEINSFMEEIAQSISEMAGEEKAMNAMLIFEEIFVNVANYAYLEGENKPITVECVKLDNGDVRLTFRDRGLPFNITNYKCKKADGEQIGGHGIRLVRELANKIEYRRSQSQNIITITL